MDIVFKDFQLFNSWKTDSEGPKWYRNGEEPVYLIDLSTGRKYLNESPWCVRFKCFLLTLGTPVVHLIASICHIAYRIFDLFNHLCLESEKPMQKRLTQVREDIFNIAMTPLVFVGLELSAIYGILRPYDGRKLYASLERSLYGQHLLAPCFQPDPTHHAFGGDLNAKNAW